MTRRTRLNRVLILGLVVSFAFHLSAVTLFRIVIYFPRENIEFVDIALVETRETLGLNEQLTIPSADEALERLTRSQQGDTDTGIAFPQIEFELPTLRFSELELLRLEQQGLQVRSQYQELFTRPSRDPWSRIGRELDRLGTLIGGPTTADPGKNTTGNLISRPAPGFEAYLEWLNEPKDRQVLAVKSIEALRGLEPTALQEPISLLVRVNRDGRVVGILDPLGPDDNLIEQTVDAIFQYKFEPINEDGPATHTCTFLIRGIGTER